MGLDYGIISGNYIAEFDYRIMLWNYITGSHYGIISRNDIMKFYHVSIFMKRIPGMTGTSPELPGISRIPWVRL